MLTRSARLLVLSLVIAAGTGYYFFGLLIPASRVVNSARNLGGGYGFGNDFYPIWLTTRTLPHGVDPYAHSTEGMIEVGLYGRPLDRAKPVDAAINYRGFSYPLYTDILAAPLALLPFHSVQIVLCILLALLTAVGVACWFDVLGLDASPIWLAFATLLTLFNCPVQEGLYALQPTLVVAALIAAAIAALRHDRFALAGILLALASIKPHLIFPLVTWLSLWALGDWRRRKNLVISFAAWVAALLIASYFVMPGWWLSWWHNLPAYRRYTTPPLAQLVLGNILGRLLGLVLVAFAGIAAVRWRRLPADSAQFQLLTAFVLLLTVIVISSSIAVYDHILLLPALLWLYAHREGILRANRPVRIVTLLMLGALFWPWVSATLISSASPFFFWAHSYRAILLPLATAASFPFAVLSLGAFFLAQAMRGES
jgi:hypothetical protein